MVNSQQLIAKSSLTPEQEQQFKYYWYAAREAIEQEKYPEAYALLEFCHLLNPNDGMTLYQLGVIQTGLKHEEEARHPGAHRHSSHQCGRSDTTQLLQTTLPPAVA